MMESRQRILEKFIRIDADEVLNQIEGRSANEIGGLLEILPVEQRAVLVSRMNRQMAARIIDRFESAWSAGFMEFIPPASVVNILRQLEDRKKKSILKALPDSLSRSINQMLSYPEDTAGAHIDPGVFTLFEDQLIGQAIEMIKKEPQSVQANLFVLSRDQRLTGYVELPALIAEDSEKKIRMVMKTEIPRVPAGMDMGVLIEGRFWHDSFNQLPVVDTREIFLGVITRESLTGIERKRNSAALQARQASMALGDLFQIGLTGIFRSATDIIWEDKSKNK